MNDRRDPALEADDTDRPTGTDPKLERLAKARESFRAIQTSESKQREREREDLQFYAGEQWPADVKIARAGQNASNGLPPVPARPCLVINKAREPVRQVLNQERQSDIGVTIVPADDFGGLGEPASPEEIELREGFLRRIQRTSDAASARTWAFERATIAGRGYYGVMTRFGDGKTRDKEIYVRRFYNQAAVSLGPHEEPDGSDCEEAFVGSFIPWDQFKVEYPVTDTGENNPLIDRLSDNEDFKTEAELYPDWYHDESERKMIHVAEHWYTTRTSRELVFLDDNRDVWADELTEADKRLMVNANGEEIGRRTVTTKQIKFEIIAGGTQTFNEADWEGKYIPIVKVLGEELQPYDSERRVEGMVRPGRDSGTGFNYMVSKLVETVGLTPIPPLILDPESIEGFEEWYKAASTRTLPWLPQRTRGDDGREFREAHRPSVDPNLQPMALAIQLFSEFIQSTMGVHDPSLGKVDPRLKSGKAIDSVILQDAHGTSNYADNLHRSVHYEGKIENDLLYPIYGKRPGRIAKIVDGHGETQHVVLGQPFVTNGGKPQVVPPGTEGARTLSLSPDPNLNIAIKVTKNVDLKRDQTAEFLGGLIQSNPEKFMAEFGDMFFKAIDVPEHLEMAERAKIMLAPPIQQAMAAKQQGMNIPPPVQAHIAQMQKQLQELEGIAGAMNRKLETEQAKYDNQFKIEQMKLDSATQRDAAANETKLAVAELGAKIEHLTLFMEERARLGVQSHEAAMAAAGAGHDQNMAELEHDHAMQQGAQQAAQAPQPEQAGV